MGDLIYCVYAGYNGPRIRGPRTGAKSNINSINADKQPHSTESEDYNLLLDPLINSIVIRLYILYLQIGYV